MNTISTQALANERHHPVHDARHLTVDGALAGLAGGLAMGLVAVVTAQIMATPGGPWAPVKAVAGTVLPGAELVQPGFDAGPVLVGGLLHLLMATLLGVVFAWLFRRGLQLRLNLGLPFLVGSIYGIFLWSLTFVYLPLVNPLMASTDKPAFLLAHVVYGATVGLVFERLAERRPNPEAGIVPLT